MDEDDPHSIDLQRRRAVHASHALRHPARFRVGTYATTFVALRPVDGGTEPCRIDLLKHGIEGGQGYYAHLAPPDGAGEASCSLDIPLQPLDRASVLRLFGLSGTAHGDLVDDLGDALAQAWVAEGLGERVCAGELAPVARSWEAERIARAGLAEIRGLLPASFAQASVFLAPHGMAGRATFGDYTVNMLVRDEALCALVAELGGLAPLAIERWDVVGRTTFGSAAEFVHGVLGGVPMDDGRAVTLGEAEWLHRTFGKVPSASVTEQVCVALVSYRRAIRSRELNESDRAALGLVLAFAGLADAKTAHRDVLRLMGDLGAPDGLPFAFLSGVKRHRDATGQATEAIATKLATDARDLWDAAWHAIASKVAQGVATLREPGVLPLLLWDGRDPAVRTLMDGVLRLATAATCRGAGSEGLLTSTDAWLRAGRPGSGAGKVAGLFARRTFREVDMNKDRGGVEHDALLGFVMDILGLDLLPELQALSEEVAAMATGMHERWLRQEYPQADADETGDAVASTVDGEAASPQDGTALEDGTVADGLEGGRVAPESGTEALAGPVSWLKRASSLGHVLALRRNARNPTVAPEGDAPPSGPAPGGQEEAGGVATFPGDGHRAREGTPSSAAV